MTRVNDNAKNQAIRKQQRIDSSKNIQRTDNKSNIVTPNKIPFNTVLDQSKNQSSNSKFNNSPNKQSESSNKAATEHAVKDARHETNERNKDKDSRMKEKNHDSDEGKEAGTAKDKGQKAKVAQQKVVARSALGKRAQQDSSGSGRQSMTQGEGEKAKSMDELKAKSLSKKGEVASEGELGQGTFAQKMAATKTANAATQVLPKQVMDQIVSYVRLMTNPDGKKEMEIRLSEKIFRGLRLKVSVLEGKVQTTLFAQTEEARELLEANRGLLSERLSKKGIDIEGIDVILDSDS